MSSGTLPLDTYHRTQALGDGSFGSVITVYNNDGEPYAMKLFYEEEEDNEDNTMEVGALVEISMLRLLREQNGHFNLIQMIDVRGAAGEYEEEDEDDDCAGAGTAGILGMVMPMYTLGSLEQALENNNPLIIQSRPNKIRIAHGLLSAIAFLHDNGILHRDIKGDNVMLREVENNHDMVDSVLIDFSLAKFVNATVYGQTDLPHFLTLDTKEPTTHTGQVGTATYMSPECNASQPYGLPSDMWSIGVVLLEILQKKPFQAVKASQAQSLIQEALNKLPQDKPFPTLVRNLLQKDPNDRWTARQALENMSTTLFVKMDNPIPPVKLIDMKHAIPNGDDVDEVDNGEENVAPPPKNSNTNTPSPRKGGNKSPKKKKIDPVIARRWKLVQQIGNEVNAVHPLTLHATMSYAAHMIELDDELDDIKNSQTLLDCLVLAYKLFEPLSLDLNELDGSETYKSFANWSLEEYKDNERTIFLMMDHCLYPRELMDL